MAPFEPSEPVIDVDCVMRFFTGFKKSAPPSLVKIGNKAQFLLTKDTVFANHIQSFKSEFQGAKIAG